MLAETKKRWLGKKINRALVDGKKLSRSGKNGLVFDSKFMDYDYNEICLYAEITLDEEGVIKAISKISKEILVGDDALCSTYRNSRPDEYDYDLLEEELEKILDVPEKEELED